MTQWKDVARRAVRPAGAVIEVLEERKLLAVSAAEYADIRDRYAEFALPADMAQINVIEITPDQLSVANLQSAVAAAAATALPDLIVARTTDTLNTITYSASSDIIAISASNGASSIIGYGTAPLTLDANSKGGVVSVAGGGSGSAAMAKLGGMVLTHGLAPRGGAITIAGSVVLKNLTISGNVSAGFDSDGGGLYQSGGTSTLINVTISGNTASAGDGGGMYLFGGDSILKNVTISGNVCHDDDGDGGGGGWYQRGGSLTLTNVIISGNTANGYTTGTSGGGGLCQYTGTLTMTNVVVSGNTMTTGHGGGVSLGSPFGGVISSTLINVTIAGNKANRGGGLYTSSSSSATTLENSIIAGNTADTGPDVYRGNGSLGGANNLIGVGDGQTSFVDGVSGNVVGDSSAPVDPGFISMSGSVWTAWDLHLAAGSAAVNAGDNSFVPSGITTDLDGKARIVDDVVDMGAYERQTIADQIIADDQGIMVGYETLYAGAVTATDSHGHSLTYSPSSPPVHGELVLQSNGAFTYMPADGYTGPDVFRFWANDDFGISNTGTVSIWVNPPNQQPIIADQSFYVGEHSEMGRQIGAVQASDPDDDAISFAIVAGDPNGVFVIDATTGMIEVLRPGYLADEAMPRMYGLTVEVRDDGIPSLTNQATVTINVITGWATDFNLSNAAVAENQPAGIVVGSILSTDPEGDDTITYTLINGWGDNDNGSFAIVGNTLLTAVSFNYEVKNNYSIRVRASKTSSQYMEKIFSIAVTNVNEAPMDLMLAGHGVPEGQPIGTSVGKLSATSPGGGESFTYALVNGEGDDDNAEFGIRGDRLVTATTFSYVRGREYAVRIRATDLMGLSLEKQFVVQGVVVFEFGLADGGVHKSFSAVDSDGDLVKFSLSGGGQGSFWDNQIGMIDTTAKSVLNISVKKGKSGDGLYQIGDIICDGLLKSVSAKSVVLNGEMLLNSLGRTAGKSAVSLAFRQISDAEIQVPGLAVSSIAVGGGISGSRISATAAIGKITAMELLDSEILVGVASDFGRQFAAAAGDFANPAAKLGSLTVSGRKLTPGQAAPAYVTESHISAPTVGTVKLLNVPEALGPVVHVLNDTGTLIVSQSKLVNGTMLAGGTWKTAGVRPAIWEAV